MRVRAKIEIKNTLCGKPLVRVRTKMEKTHFVVGLWLGLLQKIEKTPLL